jgi:UDP-N-acetylmuramate--alanine ligase
VNLNDYDSIYFLGIGGIGMSKLASWFKRSGKRAGGYNDVPTSALVDLIAEGLDIHFEDDAELIPPYVNKSTTLVIYTPAVSSSLGEWKYLKDNGFTIMKRSEVLALIAKEYEARAAAKPHTAMDIVKELEQLIV